MDLVLIHPEVLLENAQISVLNGSKIEGKASQTASRLRRLGFHVIDVGNYDSERPVFRTFLNDFSHDEKEKTREILEDVFDDASSNIIPPEEVPSDSLIDLQVILGTN